MKSISILIKALYSEPIVFLLILWNYAILLLDLITYCLQLLLMKRGGQVIYVGPLCRQSHKFVWYFEAIPRVPKIRGGHNPTTWMLDVSLTTIEAQLNVDFAEIYVNSELYP